MTATDDTELDPITTRSDPDGPAGRGEPHPDPALPAAGARTVATSVPELVAPAQATTSAPDAAG